MRDFRKDNHAAVAMIITGILILVLSVIAIAIIFPVMSSVDVSSYDTQLHNNLWASAGNPSDAANYTPVRNASTTVLSTSGTVLGLNPIAALVAVAAGIIGLLIGAFAFGGGTKVSL